MAEAGLNYTLNEIEKKANDLLTLPKGEAEFYTLLDEWVAKSLTVYDTFEKIDGIENIYAEIKVEGQNGDYEVFSTGNMDKEKRTVSKGINVIYISEVNRTGKVVTCLLMHFT